MTRLRPDPRVAEALRSYIAAAADPEVSPVQMDRYARALSDAQAAERTCLVNAPARTRPTGFDPAVVRKREDLMWAPALGAFLPVEVRLRYRDRAEELRRRREGTEEAVK